MPKNRKFRKYVQYELTSETENTKFYDDYSEAFSDYMRYEFSATLYGIAEDGGIEVIFSK